MIRGRSGANLRCMSGIELAGVAYVIMIIVFIVHAPAARSRPTDVDRTSVGKRSANRR